jgi:hypothetical protein
MNGRKDRRILSQERQITNREGKGKEGWNWHNGWCFSAFERGVLVWIISERAGMRWLVPSVTTRAYDTSSPVLRAYVIECTIALSKRGSKMRGASQAYIVEIAEKRRE